MKVTSFNSTYNFFVKKERLLNSIRIFVGS